MELKIGTILHNGLRPYTIEKILGSGGFGITYKASAIVDSKSGPIKTFYAIKELFIKDWNERKSNDSFVSTSTPIQQRMIDAKKDFIAEARRLSMINHPNIVRVYEQFEENGTAYYVMEYLHGDNLNTLISKNGPLSINSLKTILAPICNAVESLHVNHITHLDIKPANIMLKTIGNHITPVLIDFGLAKHYDNNGNATSKIRIQGCSDGYSPIEQYAGINNFCPQSDIYALAATMIFCLTGQNPPKAIEINEQIILQILPNDIPINIKNAIIHATRNNLNERTSSINHFVYEINNDSQTINTPTTKRMQISTASIAIVIIVVALIGIIAWLLVDRFNSSPNTEPISNKNSSNTTDTIYITEKDTTSTNQNEAEPNVSSESSPRQAMVINDADGWTNVRSAQSSKASIVDKVYDGTVFYVTYINGSKWCKFYWDENSPSVGYIYKKYIKPVGSNKTPPNQAKVKTHYGKYHIIVGSYRNRAEAENLYIAALNANFDPQIIYNSSVNSYRVSAYSSNSKSDANDMLNTVRYHFPNAWISND